LSPAVLSDIYLGKVTTWNDAAIAKLNPSQKLPSQPIVVVHRSDGSGTTYIFTDYLSHVSAEWKAKVGTGKSVSWPAQSSVGGKGNEGVAGQVSNSPGAIGYVELAYVIQNHMPAATLQNKAGKWVADAPGGVRAAAASRPDVSPTAFSIVDEGCATCYPIAGYSWVVLYSNPSDKARGKQLVDLFRWVSSDAGQKLAASLQYVPLPDNMQALADKALAQVHV
jgi:phosphate transport system substrate-binding protein